MRKVGLFISLLLTLHFAGFAQLSEVDHIKRSINQITDSLKYVDALNRLGTLMYERNLDSSFALTRKAREIANRHNYSRGKADAFTSLGTFFYYKGNLQLGLRYLNDALTIYKDIKDSANVVQSMMNIANIYSSSGKIERSQQWYEKALKAGSELRNDSIMALVIWDYMFSYPKKFTNRNKEINIIKIKEIANRYKDSLGTAVMDKINGVEYGNKARVLMAKNRLDEAEQLSRIQRAKWSPSQFLCWLKHVRRNPLFEWIS